LRGLERLPSLRGPRVRGLIRGYMPSPASRVREALFAAPPTGSRTHPWATCHHPLRGLERLSSRRRPHGFADSPVGYMPSPASRVRDALSRSPRVRGLTRGYLPPPSSRFREPPFVARPTGSRTHPWLHAITRFAGSFTSRGVLSLSMTLQL